MARPDSWCQDIASSCSTMRRPRFPSTHQATSGSAVRPRQLGIGVRTDATRRTFVGEWVRTGDIYQRSQDERFAYLGRSDELFKVSGEWVSPFEIESVLTGLGGVFEAAVVPGLFDGLLRPVAFVVLASDSNDSEESLQAQCKPLLPGFKRPRRIRVVDGLPKTAVGKIQRVVLRDQLHDEMTGA